jgi:hypothetical protein
MRFTGLLSVGAVAIGALLLAAGTGAATPGSSAYVLAGKATSLLLPATCIKIAGETTCINKKKHQSKNNDDDNGKSDKGTKTVKLIKEQGTCAVSTPGMGGGGCTSPKIRRCDKLEDGDQVCCCYHVDDSQPPQ